MNWLLNQLGVPVREFALEHPWGALILAMILILPPLFLSYWRLAHVIREQTLGLGDKRFAWLKKVLESNKPLDQFRLLDLELSFERAYGYKYTSDEIQFVMQRRNPSSLLFDLRHAQEYVEFNEQQDGFVQKNVKTNLKTSQVIAGAGFLLCALFVIFALVMMVVSPLLSLMMLVELAVFMIYCFKWSRSISCAKRLLSLEGHQRIFQENTVSRAHADLLPKLVRNRCGICG